MRQALVVGLMTVVVALSALAGSASAAVDEPASCKGILTSAGAGEAGEVADNTRLIHQIVKDLGLPPGVYVSAAAGHLHEEDFLACLEALGF